MKREDKHRLSQLLAMTGFIMIPLGGLAYGFMSLQPSIGAVLAALGFIVFLVGAELAFKTKQESPDEDS